MRKILISIVGALVFCTAFAAGENIPTSKSYVDAGVAEKQDKISANNGAAQVLTNTGTAGEYGTKDIYNSTNAYATQTDALIDAVTMNTAVQNAIDSEFQCVEYNPNDPTDCWLMDVFGQTPTQSKNLFDSSQLLNAAGWTESNGVYTGQISQLYRLGNMNACDFECKPNTQYTLSYTVTVDENAQPAGSVKPWLAIRYTDGTSKYISYNDMPNLPGETRHSVLISDPNKTVGFIYGSYGNGAIVHFSDIQLEEGTSATPYQPYGANIYIPSGN